MSYSSEVLADSPLAYYRLDEASGTALVDSSGNGRNGSYVNAPTLGAAGLLVGDSDTSVTFNGSNQYASVPSAAWQVPARLTAEAWVRLTVATGEIRVVSSDNAGASSFSRSWTLFTSNGTPTFGLFIGGSFISATGAALTAGTTYHLVGTYDGAAIRMYVNGTLGGTTNVTGAINATAAPLTIAASGFPHAYMNGRVDEAAVYGTALSATRISAHYAAGTAATVSAKKFVGWGIPLSGA